MIKSARYRMTFIEATCPVAHQDAEIYVLMDDDFFPQANENWAPIIEHKGEIIRMTAMRIESVQEISPGTYGLKVCWIDEDTKEIELRTNPDTGLMVPMRGSVRLERVEDG